MMKKKTKKVARRATAAVLCLSMLGVGASLAYLTDSEATTNTFTAGQVQIDLEEMLWDQAMDTDGNGIPDQAENMVPNEIVGKDPVVENTGANDAIVFLRVKSPKKMVTVCEDNGTKGERKIQELFNFKSQSFRGYDNPIIHENGWDSSWTELKSRENEDDTQKTYVFAYIMTLKPGEKTFALFDQVQLKNLIEGDLGVDEIANIEVTALAIQADHVLKADGAVESDEHGELSDEDLLYAYDTLLNQDTYGFGNSEHPNDPFKQANDWGKYDLNGNVIDGSDINDSNEPINPDPGGNDQDQTYGYTVLQDGGTVNEKIKALVGVGRDDTDTQIQSISFATAKASDEAMIAAYDADSASAGTVVSDDLSKTQVVASYDASSRTLTLTNYVDDVASAKKIKLAPGSSGLFQGLSGLQSINLDNLDTSEVTNIGCMFMGDAALKSIDMSPFAGAKLKDINGLFQECSSLTSVDLSMLDTSETSTMSSLLWQCSNLETVNLGDMQTNSVIDMSYAFCMCPKLQTLDLSSFDTSHVTNMAAMFTGDSALATIYASNKFVTTAVTDPSAQMFTPGVLVGGNGTTVDVDANGMAAMGATFAHVDTVDNPGYFTAK